LEQMLLAPVGWHGHAMKPSDNWSFTHDCYA
jgi:hypothetical protein